MLEKLKSYMVEDMECGSYAQNDIDLFCLWRGSAFCNGFIDFCNELFIETVHSVICLLRQCVTWALCTQSSNFYEDFFATLNSTFF